MLAIAEDGLRMVVVLARDVGIVARGLRVYHPPRIEWGVISIHPPKLGLAFGLRVYHPPRLAGMRKIAGTLARALRFL